MINREQQIDYLKRLMFDSYTKKGKTRFFIFQYLGGAGNELTKKFWSEHSSSRLAFELYSALAKDDNVEDFEFEKQLKAPNSGGMGPNMDVYLETDDEIIFIESKFTEKANLNYINFTKPGDSYLSPAYWSKETYGRRKMSLQERLDKRFAEEFSDLCIEWEKTMQSHSWRKKGYVDWFEPKQETCHLSGILFFLFDANNRDLLKKKKNIRLFNIYWDLGGEVKSEMEEAFVQKANSTMKKILDANKEELGMIDFRMDAFSVQKMLSCPALLSNKINNFGDDIETRLAQFKAAVRGKTRKSFQNSESLD